MPKIAKQTLFLLIVAFALLGASLAIFPALVPRLFANKPSNLVSNTSPSLLAADTDLAARVSRVENGLLPAVLIKDAPRKPMTILERMAFYNVPGVSVALFDHGQIVWTRAYGFADITSKKPVTPDTLFQAGSISKPVSALGALRLVQDGKLSLDEDINIKLRTWKVPETGFPDMGRVTVRRILSHSAGLTVSSFLGYSSGENIPSVVQILNGETPANNPPIRVEVAPGTQWRYSGGGFVVLQTLMSDVTGRRFTEIMRELVLDPAGMTHSTFDQPFTKKRAVETTTPYHANGDPIKGGPHIYPEMAAAGLWTTPSDLARMAMEVQEEYMGKSSKILRQSMAQQMLSDQIGNWGLGFALQEPGHPAHFFHGGGTAGYACYLDGYTDTGQGFAIMTNSDGAGRLIEEVFRSVATEYGWPDHRPVEILGLSLGGVAFVAVPCLIVLTYEKWTQGSRQQVPPWRSVVGLACMVGTFLSWLGLAVLTLSILMHPSTSLFSPEWIPRIALLTFTGTFFGFALRGASRMGAILTGLLMVTAWLTSA